MDNYTTTFETWNKLAALYQEKFMDLDLYNDSYDRFCKLVEKKNASILEVGCGPGNITRYLVAAMPDFNILATDVAPNMIDLASANNPTVDCRVMDCRHINTIKEKFDGIICGFCVPYLSAEDCAAFITHSAFLLNKEGILYFSTIKGDYNQSGFEKGSTGDSCYVYYYEEFFFKKELLKNGFDIVDISEKDFLKANGATMVNQIFIAKKK